MDQGWESYRRYLAGDDEGLVELLRDYKDGLLFFLMRYVGNFHAAEELTEEAFFRLAVKKPLFMPRASFKTWLYTLGRNLAVDCLRRRERLSPLPEDQAGEAEGLEEAYLKEERKRILHGALSKLKSDYALVLHLKYFAQLTNEETARVMKKTRRQVENLTYQAKRALRAQLEQEGVTDEDL